VGVPDRAQHEGSLRDRKRRRAQEAIRAAALELFTERGYDEVTVADIAERAEVGRTTFFRYFGDKQEVLFSSDEQEAAAAFADVKPPARPIGTSLVDALGYVRAIVVGFVKHITADPEAYEMHQRLVGRYPELHARSLEKQRRYVALLTDELVARGADASTARLGAELGLACFYAGQWAAGDDPHLLPRHVAKAFARLDGRVKRASPR
jgi:AcrR family transcriptional regulator